MTYIPPMPDDQAFKFGPVEYGMMIVITVGVVIIITEVFMRAGSI